MTLIRPLTTTAGLHACLEQDARDSADKLLNSILDIISTSPARASAPLPLPGTHTHTHTHALAGEYAEVDLVVSSVTLPGRASSKWSTQISDSDSHTSGHLAQKEEEVATDVEEWISGMATSLTEALGLQPGTLELSVHAVVATPSITGMPSSITSIPSTLVPNTPAGRSPSSVATPMRPPSAGTRRPPINSAPSQPRTVTGGGGYRGEGVGLVVVRARLQDRSAVEALTTSTTAGMGLRNWRKLYNVTNAHVPCGAFRLWVSKPLPILKGVHH